MAENMVSVIDIANKWEKRKQSIFKVIKKLNIEIHKEANSSARGQLIAYVTMEDEERIDEYLGKVISEDQSENQSTSFELSGVFYLVQLEPQHDPGRFKVGFATSVEDRIRQHKCSAPVLKLIQTWPCKILWEKTAIDSVTQNCEKIHTEVFRTDSIDIVKDRCDSFFKLMPKL